ncbi:MAG: 2-oxoglutarate dehydrogenase complex dihydrolipoyllysine-residue succinyltransferase [Gammaproteobacteria bacterium]|nr:2-oxoglutarate dehydrogenase complex dihydrolipoyllysine-residue succinyltransferase [Gammaproteobacteria bacterium]MCP5460075.1 2-oxoglutarate dehydrogenase complex dihydrolipoyllysine-residue succinyltransferase [Gammaproteobacteria bacterium]
MSVEVRVPTLPESVADATLVNWHKKPGEPVQRGENLVDLETDKVVLEIPAPTDGVMGEILKGEGEVVKAGDLIANMEEGAAQSSTPAPAPSAVPVATEEAKPAAVIDDESLSPAVRRLVREHQLDAGKISGTGRGGRVTKADVLAYIEAQAAAPVAPPPAPTPAPVATVPAVPSSPVATTPLAERVPPDSRGRLEQRVPMTRLRARIAERLVEAQHTAAMLTTFNEVNMQPVMDLRNRYRDKFEKTYGIRLGIMSFYVKAVIEALKRFPAVNGSIDGNDIIYHGYYDIGIAVSSPRGLVVPIVRDADQMSFADVEKTISDFGKRAKEGSLSMDDLVGGTFSVTNGGVFGSLMSTPILNPPQSAILGMHKVMDRAMVENGQIVALPMMFLALTYDHRIIDGREAVSFLVTVKECIEDPARLLLQV